MMYVVDGFGAVYKARQTKLDRLVALKIPRFDPSEDFAEALERFDGLAGLVPFLFCVIISMVLMYVYPNIVYYLPTLFYG